MQTSNGMQESLADYTESAHAVAYAEPTDEMLRAGVRAFQTSYSSDDPLADWRAFYIAAVAAAGMPSGGDRRTAEVSQTVDSKQESPVIANKQKDWNDISQPGVLDAHVACYALGIDAMGIVPSGASPTITSDDAGSSRVDTFIHGNAEKGFTVVARYKDCDAIGTSAHVYADANWVHVVTDPSEGAAMLHKECLPLLIRSLSELARKSLVHPHQK